MSQKRVISVNNPSLELNGLRLGDQVTIYPAMGNRKTIKLDRTIFELEQSSIFNIEKDACNIKIPGGSTLSGDRYELLLCVNQASGELDESSRYILKSIGQRPFRINGVYSYEAYVERGDVIDLGYNRFKFDPIVKLLNGDSRTNKVLSSRFVKSDLNVLIEGETGTGKTRLASLIHDESGRAGRFVHLNLSSFSENLIESEIFGHVRGAFTGASHDKDGAVYEARGGTLFLDEIDSLPKSIQTKLLLFLDNKKIRPVGGQRERKVDVRLIFASGKCLKKLSEIGSFRTDFYYRISSGVSFKLPPLREDIELIRDICDQVSINKNVYFTPQLINYYMSRKWSGNIRELIGHINKKVVLTNGNKIEYCQMDEALLGKVDDICEESFDEMKTMKDLKNAYMLKTFMRVNCSAERTAKVLRVSPTTVRTFLKSEKIAC